MSMLIMMSSATGEDGAVQRTTSVQSVGRLQFGVAIAVGAVGTLMTGM
jgi:hypothetical protein